MQDFTHYLVLFKFENGFTVYNKWSNPFYHDFEVAIKDAKFRFTEAQKINPNNRDRETPPTGWAVLGIRLGESEDRAVVLAQSRDMRDDVTKMHWVTPEEQKLIEAKKVKDNHDE